METLHLYLVLYQITLRVNLSDFHILLDSTARACSGYGKTTTSTIKASDQSVRQRPVTGAPHKIRLVKQSIFCFNPL